MRLYAPIAKVDAEQRMVWGYASTEAVDEQGEIVARAALAAALDDYMRFANIREMHQLSAVGVAKEAAVDDRGLYVGARITDDRAWAKIREGVYKGFSIGGRVVGRDPGDRKIVTALSLNEISLVDRPANPDAVFDCWKAEGANAMGMTAARRIDPVQVWACGTLGHEHLGKAEAARCIAARGAGDAGEAIAAVEGAVAAAESALAKAGEGDPAVRSAAAADYADPGYQPDGKKRYPLDRDSHIRAAWAYIHKPKNAGKYTPDQLDRIKARIVAAWKSRIDPKGPPLSDPQNAAAAQAAMLTKGLGEVGRLAHIILDLHWLGEVLALEAAIEGDGSPEPARLAGIVEELCGALDAMVAEETAELLDGGGAGDLPDMAEAMAMAAGAGGAVGGRLRQPPLADRSEALAKTLADNAALMQTLCDIVPRLDRLAKRVEDIAQTPLPPQTVARGPAGLSKRQDGAADAGIDAQNVVAALAQMTNDERTMTLIKAAHANPIRR